MRSMISKTATNLNGISIAYIMGLANAAFACLVTYGITLTPEEIGSTLALLNAILAVAFHFGHRVGEATAAGSATAQSAQTFGPATQAAETPHK